MDNFNGKTLAMTVNAPEDEPLIQVLLKQANDLTLLVSFSYTVPAVQPNLFILLLHGSLLARGAQSPPEKSPVTVGHVDYPSNA